MDQMDNNMENNMQPAGMGQPDGMGDNKGWAIAALVLGILSIVLLCSHGSMCTLA